MKRWRAIIGIGVLCCLLGCGAVVQQQQGGTETGNPDTGETRTITGTVDGGASDSVSKRLALTTNCDADTVFAFTGRDGGTSAAVADDCTFSLAVDADDAYMLIFVRAFQLAGVMLFDNRATAFAAPVAVVSAGDQNIQLGSITIVAGDATPAQRLAEQNDQDADGIDDYNDNDDDGDGTADDDEADCDLDGIQDTYDGDTADCSADSGDATQASMFEVVPRNDRLRDTERRFAGLSEPVRARFACELKQDTVTTATFQVQDSGGNPVACTYNFGNSGRGVECRHSTSFTASTVYTAQINGIQCVDGRTVSSRTWSWRTRAQ